MRGMLKSAAVALAMMSHNGPPAMMGYSTPAPSERTQRTLPRRIIDEQRRNQKLKQKRRRLKRLQDLHERIRPQRKTRKYGSGYRPGKLFKGHRV